MSVVIACSHCGTKYKVDPAKFSSPTPKIRCKKCNEVFQADLTSGVQEPTQPESTPTAAPASAPEPTPSSTPAATAPVQAVAAGTGGASLQGSPDAIAVLFAHDSDDIRGTIDTVATNAGFKYKSVNNGIDALVELQSGAYDVAVLDVALPRMFGFEVCEVVRRDSALDKTKLLLIAAIYDQQRYRRPPSTLYGADGYIEKQDLDVHFVDKIREVYAASRGSEAAAVPSQQEEASTTERPQSASAVEPATPAQSTPEQASTPSAPEVSVPVAATPPAASETSSTAASGTSGGSQSAPASGEVPDGIEKRDLEKARRLGRVIVSDLALYNQEVFKTAVSADDIYAALGKDIQDSREQINIKVSQAIRDFEDVLDVAIKNYLANR